jgi:hypothetical protein
MGEPKYSDIEQETVEEAVEPKVEVEQETAESEK